MRECVNIYFFFILEITDPEGDGVKRNSPDVIYPEVLVVVDYSMYK